MDVVYRLARADDLQGIIDIDKNFIFGFDYIEAVFYHWLGDTRYYVYVAEVDGTVVRTIHSVHA